MSNKKIATGVVHSVPDDLQKYLLADSAAGVANVDINPFSLGARGEACVALDAVIYLEKSRV